MTNATSIGNVTSPISGIPLYPLDDIFEYSPFERGALSPQSIGLGETITFPNLMILLVRQVPLSNQTCQISS